MCPDSSLTPFSHLRSNSLARGFSALRYSCRAEALAKADEFFRGQSPSSRPLSYFIFGCLPLRDLLVAPPFPPPPPIRPPSDGPARQETGHEASVWPKRSIRVSSLLLALFRFFAGVETLNLGGFYVCCPVSVAAKAPAVVAPKRRYGAPRRWMARRTPKPAAILHDPGKREASWSAVVLYRFDRGRHISKEDVHGVRTTV